MKKILVSLVMVIFLLLIFNYSLQAEENNDLSLIRERDSDFENIVYNQARMPIFGPPEAAQTTVDLTVDWNNEDPLLDQGSSQQNRNLITLGSSIIGGGLIGNFAAEEPIVGITAGGLLGVAISIADNHSFGEKLAEEIADYNIEQWEEILFDNEE